MKKILFLLFTCLLLTSCSSNRKYFKNENCIKNINGVNVLISQLTHDVKNIWKFNEALIVGSKDYVRYVDHHNTRIYINFNTKKITIETVVLNNPRAHLRQAIIDAFFVSGNLIKINFYSKAHKTRTDQNHILYGEILNIKNKPWRAQWHTKDFADHLIQSCLQSRKTTGLRKVWFITINLIPNNFFKNTQKYLSIIRKASKRYGVDQSLISAIMQTESNINPYAVSHANALGLMQIMRNSAGRDVFRMKKKYGQPSRKYLLNPENNIDTGAAYLAILQNSYLCGIINPISRRYAVITAYNSGVGSVLRVFSLNQHQAFKIINSMKPIEVYQKLSTLLPSEESRRYLYKVNYFQKNYRSYS